MPTFTQGEAHIIAILIAIGTMFAIALGKHLTKK